MKKKKKLKPKVQKASKIHKKLKEMPKCQKCHNLKETTGSQTKGSQTPGLETQMLEKRTKMLEKRIKKLETIVKENLVVTLNLTNHIFDVKDYIHQLSQEQSSDGLERIYSSLHFLERDIIERIKRR